LAQSIIKDSILTTIRKLLPFRSILNEYLTLEGGNNTIMIGGPSTVSNIPQLKTIENPLPVIAMPGVNTSTKLDSLLTTIKEENQPILSNAIDTYNKNETSSSSNSEDKERITGGRELNLEEIEAELEKSMDSIVKPVYAQKERSLDTLSVQKMVSNIKEEFNVQKKNVDSSIDLDELSFLKDKDDVKSISTIGLDLDKSSKSTIIHKKSNFVINNTVNSVDMERLKEEGTILNDTIPPNKFLLSSITPTIKERPIENINQHKSPQIKKISIKYNLGMPVKKNYNNGVLKKKRLTLLNEAADSDSSEMIFK
jgi:hypothetical protein